MGATGGMGKTRMEVWVSSINAFKVIRYFSHYLFLKSKRKNVYPDVFISVTSDLVCLSLAAAFTLLPFHRGEERVFALHLPVPDGEGTFQRLPGLLPSAFHACLVLWERPVVDGVSGSARPQSSPVLPALRPQSRMETICPSRNHCGAPRGRPPGHSFPRLFPVAGSSLSASTWEAYSEVCRSLSPLWAEEEGSGGRGNSTVIDFQRHLLFFADQCLRKMRPKVAILSFFSLRSWEEISWVWLDTSFLPQ